MENNILKCVCSRNKFVSSENIIGSKTEELGRSLTYNKNSNGPSIESGGTPQRMFWVPVLRSWPYEMYCFLFAMLAGEPGKIDDSITIHLKCLN